MTSPFRAPRARAPIEVTDRYLAVKDFAPRCRNECRSPDIRLLSSLDAHQLHVLAANPARDALDLGVTSHSDTAGSPVDERALPAAILPVARRTVDADG